MHAGRAGGPGERRVGAGGQSGAVAFIFMSTVVDPIADRPTDRRSVLLVVSGLMLVMLLASLDQTIVSTALPTIVGELGGLEHLSWVVTAYLLAVTIVTPLYGKLGDLYGRKIVLQGALVIFLVGSVLCGLAQGMTELIAFRAIQGLGGGGLMVSAQAAIGDVVPPRERGKWTGLFGAVFGISSIAGPLIGGFLTTNASWRWIFYVNVPLGLVALGVLAVTLPGKRERVEHSIDYVGTALLAAALSALVLATTLGGTTYDWNSPFIIAMGVITVVGLAAFVVAERHAKEPILPPSLFRNRVFTVTSAVGLVVGFALFGGLTFLPLFQQVVRGDSPTESGLQLLPVMAGLLFTSILSGQVITRTGRYRWFPIAGTAIGAVGLLLLAQLDRETSTALAALYMLIFGMGLGMVMQVLVLAVQNSVDYEMLGVATSGATLFRSIGGALGTALLGAVFSNKLSHELAANCRWAAAARRRGQRREPRSVGGRAAPGGRARRVPHVVHGVRRPRVPRRRRDHGDRVPAHLADPRAPAARHRADGRAAAGVRRAGGHRLRARGGARAQHPRRTRGRHRLPRARRGPGGPRHRAGGRLAAGPRGQRRDGRRRRSSRPPTTSTSSGCGPPAGTSTRGSS